ncbi:hypothetical protein J2S66_006781 [Saccharothrix longispora]|uniref:DUF5753 domain-containing protein n=1 Tax=Saccharothrix longispora TaxID=33920 RepID=A0ABU1Q684_9PSEU|nr:hypothetical protein [Saccharothrix longispora]
MRDQLLRLAVMCGWERMSPRLVPMAVGVSRALRASGALLTFAAPVKAVAYAETETATVFHDEPAAVVAYEAKMRRLRQVALGVEQSQAVFARWADVYERQVR